MWRVGAFCAVAAVILLMVPTGKQDGGETKPQPDTAAIVILDTDGGYATADKYLRLYARNLSKLVPVFSKRIRETDDESYDIAKDWAAATEAARKEAGVGVNARVSVLAADEKMTRQQKADWLDDAGKAWAAIGK
jgi:hypothetical protein